MHGHCGNNVKKPVPAMSAGTGEGGQFNLSCFQLLR